MLFETLEFRYLCAGGPPAPGGWELRFDDNFVGPLWSGYVQTLWGETNGTTARNVSTGPAGLTLAATKTGARYLGAEISTGGNTAAGGSVAASFSFLYGYAQATIKMPAGNAQGLWPAFWMLPTPDPGYHDGDGEIDITEVIDGQDIDNVHLHHSGYTTAGYAYKTGVNLSAAFHTYGVDWEPGTMTFYFDGAPIFSASGPIVPDVAEYLILDLWIGGAGSWPGAPNSSTVFPNAMTVRSLEVWQHTPNDKPLPGDANLDGVVNGDDYTLFDNGFNNRLTGWSNGDFNGDGIVNGADLSLLDSTFNQEEFSAGGRILTFSV